MIFNRKSVSIFKKIFELVELSHLLNYNAMVNGLILGGDAL